MQFKLGIKSKVMRVQSGRMEPLGAREDPTEDAGIELGFEDRKEGKTGLLCKIVLSWYLPALSSVCTQPSIPPPC